MSSDALIRLEGASKTYPLRRRPAAELAARLWGHVPSTGTRHALHPLDLELHPGQAVGIVGLNGAGKSTLLQLAAGVISPSSGRVHIRGRVAALLELGAAFDLEASGWDNISLYAATLGVSSSEIIDRRESIIDFAGLREFIHAPVKSYSTGMQVRLAFSVATSVDPDVLIIDEALSVGDGVFAKRSFDRIMALRDRGAALLLSSHALFHVDLFCSRTLWLHRGSARAWGPTAEVLPRYQEFLDLQAQDEQAAASSPAPTPGPPPAPSPAGTARSSSPESAAADQPPSAPQSPSATAFEFSSAENTARLLAARISLNGRPAEALSLQAGQGTLSVEFDIQATPDEPSPRAAVVLSSDSGLILGSALSPAGAFVASGPQRRGQLRFDWVDPPINRGRYRIGVYLLCSRGRFVFAWSDPHAHLVVQHEGPHQGAWLLPGQWTAQGG